MKLLYENHLYGYSHFKFIFFSVRQSKTLMFQNINNSCSSDSRVEINQTTNTPLSPSKYTPIWKTSSDCNPCFLMEGRRCCVKRMGFELENLSSPRGISKGQKALNEANKVNGEFMAVSASYIQGIPCLGPQQLKDGQDTAGQDVCGGLYLLLHSGVHCP